jgi:hypothetical protein
MITETQSLIDKVEKNFVDKNNKRESLMQSKDIDEEEHVLSSYHIKTLKKLILSDV